MQHSGAVQTPINGHSIHAWTTIKNALLQKLWLPRLVYESIPYLYLAIGLVALISAIRIPGETWILPYLALLALVCLHVGLAIITLRYKYRQASKQKGHGNLAT